MTINPLHVRYSKTVRLVETLALTARAHLGVMRAQPYEHALIAMRDAERAILTAAAGEPVSVPSMYGPKRRFGTPAGVGKGAYRSAGRWKAKAQYQGKAHHLGYFDTEEDAQKAYRIFWMNKFSR